MATVGSNIRYPIFTRKWRKYYKIEEVDWYLAQIAADSEKEKMEYTVLRSKSEEFSRVEKTLREKVTALEQQVSRQEAELEKRLLEIDQFRNQLTQSRVESVRQSEELAQQTVELARSQTRIEKLNEFISKHESQSPDDLISEAERKAEQIVAKAMADSEKVLQQINEQQAHIVAASRAAYYNALQFRQELAERFRQMEKDLDSSIDVLRVSENSRLSLLQVAKSPRIIQKSGSMIP